MERLKAKTGKVPGLAVVIVGERKDSQTYVRMKRKACDEVGIHSFHSELPETISEKELIDVVKGYNDNPDCHGILVQLPLPKHIDEEKVLGVISLEKDVDGFHPFEYRDVGDERTRTVVYAVHAERIYRFVRAKRGGIEREECGRCWEK